MTAKVTTEEHGLAKKQAMENALHELMEATIKELLRRVTEEPQNLKASMVAQILSLLKDNGVNVQSMSKAKAAQVMSALADDMDWDEFDNDIELICPSAEEPVPTRVTQ